MWRSNSAARTASSSPSRYACRTERETSHVMDSLLSSRRSEQLLEPFARSRQTGHDSTNRHRGDGGNLLVRASFQFAQNDDFARARRKLFQGLGQTFVIASG